MLSGYRALDLTRRDCWLAGRVLADLGVDVIKVEPPKGDPGRSMGPFYGNKPHNERSLYFYAYNLGKRSITLNIETTRGKEIFKSLAHKADFILESFPAGYMEKLGLGYANISAFKPQIIVVSITPFGQSGPLKEYKGSDIVSMAMGGFMYLTGDPDRPPLRISFPLSFLFASVQAVAGLMIAFHYRQRTGLGQHVDVSAQEAVANVLANAPTSWDLNQVLFKRVGRAWFRAGIDGHTQQRVLWSCRDGQVAFMAMGGAVGRDSNRALVEWMAEKGMADDFVQSIDWEHFDALTASQEFHEKVETVVGRFFMAHSKKELHEEAQKRGILLQALNTPGEILKSPQLAARKFWVQIPHEELATSVTYPGSFLQISQIPWKPRARPPLVGEHNREIYHRELGISEEELEKLAGKGII